MKTLLVTLFVLNIIDASSTIYAIEYLGAKEINPVMAAAYAYSVYMFLAVKFGVLGIVSVSLAKPTHRPILILANILFVMVVASNLVNIASVVM